MGALHDGHLSLIRAAAARCGFVAMTLFVNPLQFGEQADLDAYPRHLESDLELAAEAGADAVFAPSVAEMYPAGAPSTRVVPGPLAEMLEGRSRPGHFEGVAIVVTKLFALAGAVSAFFGEKDFQQLAVVRQLATDLDLPVEVVGCPIVREADGLAMSSRNGRLSPPERSAATVLCRALEAGRAALEAGCGPASAETTMWETIRSEPLATPDYAVVVDPRSLRRLAEEQSLVAPRGGDGSGSPGAARLLVAAEVGPVRLIDNTAGRAV
jgi:pantoate--beta-alanine ligase